MNQCCCVALLHSSEAVRRNHATRIATDEEVESEMKDWLKFASERSGARRERQLKGINREVQQPLNELDQNNNINNNKD